MSQIDGAILRGAAGEVLRLPDGSVARTPCPNCCGQNDCRASKYRPCDESLVCPVDWPNGGVIWVNQCARGLDSNGGPTPVYAPPSLPSVIKVGSICYKAESQTVDDVIPPREQWLGDGAFIASKDGEPFDCLGRQNSGGPFDTAFCGASEPQYREALPCYGFRFNDPEDRIFICSQSIRECVVFRGGRNGCYVITPGGGVPLSQIPPGASVFDTAPRPDANDNTCCRSDCGPNDPNFQPCDRVVYEGWRGCQECIPGTGVLIPRCAPCNVSSQYEFSGTSTITDITDNGDILRFTFTRTIRARYNSNGFTYFERLTSFDHLNGTLSVPIDRNDIVTYPTPRDCDGTSCARGLCGRTALQEAFSMIAPVGGDSVCSLIARGVMRGSITASPESFVLSLASSDWDNTNPAFPGDVATVKFTLNARASCASQRASTGCPQGCFGGGVGGTVGGVGGTVGDPVDPIGPGPGTGGNPVGRSGNCTTCGAATQEGW